MIDLPGPCTYANCAIVMIHSAIFGDVIIIYHGEDMVALQNFTLADLNASDFIF